jgi:hypothetical protein
MLTCAAMDYILCERRRMRPGLAMEFPLDVKYLGRTTMSHHLFHVGDAVALTPHAGHHLKTDDAYFVSALMPPLGDVLQYRVKCATEPYERVVGEHQLNRVEAEPVARVDAPKAPAKAAPKAWAGRGIRAAPAAPARARARSR